MNKIQIEKLSKIYTLKNGKSFYALKDVYLSFPSSGFVTIVGKSGSGKSTLLNMIALLDFPSKGAIYIDNKILGKQIKSSKFYKNKIGILFQNYNLIDDITTLENVSLPLLINGYSYKKAKEQAEKILKFVGINESKYKIDCSYLSGGEKQRVALARAVINNPEILLCDEPTGALDNANSLIIMNLLKEISKTSLVIVVSHNLHLTRKYSDRIIELSNGSVVYDKTISKSINTNKQKKKKISSSSRWIDKLLLKNYKKRIRRNIFSSFSLLLGITTLLLTIGFYYGKDSAVKNAAQQQLDYGVGTLSEEEVINNNSLLKLTKSTRPSLNALLNEKSIMNNYEICLNYDAIFYQKSNYYYENEIINNLIFTPIYSFKSDYIDQKLIIKGRCPTSNNFKEILINDYCYTYLLNYYKQDPIGKTIKYTNHINIIYIDNDETEIGDELDQEFNFTITGVVDELDYLPSPKIFYNYSYLDSIYDDQVLVNLSTYFNREITLKSRINDCDNSSSLSSYSYRLFPKCLYQEKPTVFSNNLVFTSSSILIEESLFGFAETIEYTIFVFLIICIIGVLLILGISSFSSYCDDKKKSAILTCLGAKKREIYLLYIGESFLTAIISFCLSIPLSLMLAKILNPIITRATDVSNLITIPLDTINGMPLLLPLIILGVVLFISLVVTILPIKFSKNNDIKSELQSL